MVYNIPVNPINIMKEKVKKFVDIYINANYPGAVQKNREGLYKLVDDARKFVHFQRNENHHGDDALMEKLETYVQRLDISDIERDVVFDCALNLNA